MKLTRAAMGTARPSQPLVHYPTVFIQVPRFSQRTIDIMRGKDGIETISGVGDEAYFHNNANRYAELLVRAGKHLLTLTRTAYWVLVAATIALPAAGHGQEPAPVTIPATRAFELESKINGRHYRLFASLPESYADDDTTRYPVLYVLDGNTVFGLATDTHRALRIFGEVAEVIIVGIGYDARFFMDTFVPRWTDYTPSRDISADTSFARRFLSNRSDSTLRSGGGAQFLQVLRQEVIPFVEAQLRTTRDRGLWGHSFGGLFALHVLFEHPGLFTRYGISSPSLWWNQQEMIARETRYARDHKALPGRVYLSVGSQEEHQLFDSFSAALKARGYGQLQLLSHVFEGETHASVVAATMSRSLRFLHGVTPSR